MTKSGFSFHICYSSFRFYFHLSGLSHLVLVSLVSCVEEHFFVEWDDKPGVLISQEMHAMAIFVRELGWFNPPAQNG